MEMTSVNPRVILPEAKPPERFCPGCDNQRTVVEQDPDKYRICHECRAVFEAAQSSARKDPPSLENKEIKIQRQCPSTYKEKDEESWKANLETAAKSGNAKGFKNLMEGGGPLSAKTRSALVLENIHACKGGTVEILKEIYKLGSIFIDSWDTAIQQAIFYNRLDILRQILSLPPMSETGGQDSEFGEKIRKSFKKNFGQAAEAGRIEIVEYMMARTTLHAVMFYDKKYSTEMREHGLNCAAKAGQIQMVKRLLLDGSISKEAYRSAAALATHNKHESIAELLTPNLAGCMSCIVS